MSRASSNMVPESRRRTVHILGVEAEVARAFLPRLLGLMFRRKPPAPGTGLLITRCRSIHTCFMRFPIDAIFLDASGAPVKTMRNIRPWRLFIWGGWKAVQVLETAYVQNVQPSAPNNFFGPKKILLDKTSGICKN